MSDENAAVVPVEEPEEKKPGQKPAALLLKRGPRGTKFGTVEEALGYATACFRSGMLPDHIKNAQQAFVIMDNGAELGLKPWSSWRVVYVTKHGRITITSKGALAIAQACPNFESYDERIELEGTDQMKGVALAKRKGKPVTVKTFTLEDAKTAGLTTKKTNKRGEAYDSPWQSYLKDMLLARARDRALNVAFAAELAGIELETIAEDADRLEARAAGEGVTPVGPPREEADVQEPKALPPGKADPLLLHVLKQTGEATTTAAKQLDAQLSGEKPEEEISKGVDEALGEPEAAAEPPKKRRTKVRKVGDIINQGTRRVLEVDEDGRPRVVEALSKEEQKALREEAKKGPSEPTEPGPPAEEPRDPPEEPGPQNCPREHCKAPLNLIGQCDACGWPTANLEV